MRLAIQIDVAHRFDVTGFTSPYTNRCAAAVLFPAIAHHICNVELSRNVICNVERFEKSLPWQVMSGYATLMMPVRTEAAVHSYACLRQWPHHSAGVTDVQLPVNPFSMK